MTLITNPPPVLSQSNGVINEARGFYTGDGTQGSITPAIGFTPRYVKVWNVTDLLMYEYFEGMDPTVPPVQTLLTTGSTGAVTSDTNGNIVTNAVVYSATENKADASGTQTVVQIETDKTKPNLSFVGGSSGARMNVNAKLYYWEARG